MISNLTIVICLYNKDINESATLQSLLNFKDFKDYSTIFIWDNSKEVINQQSFIFLNNHFKNLIYKHTPENVALSKIYNAVIDSLEEDSYLMLCDDDSDIPLSFFEILEEQIKLNPYQDLFLPQIYSNSVLVSPAKDFLIKTALIKNLKAGTIHSSNITAINSGMVISSRFFNEGFRYDERLRFYGTDNYFMNEYSKLRKDLIVLDIKFTHSLSFNDSNDVNNKLRIFKEVKRSNAIIYSDQFFKRQIVLFNNLVVACKLSLKHKTFRFFSN